MQTEKIIYVKFDIWRKLKNVLSDYFPLFPSMYMYPSLENSVDCSLGHFITAVSSSLSLAECLPLKPSFVDPKKL